MWSFLGFKGPSRPRKGPQVVRGTCFQILCALLQFVSTRPCHWAAHLHTPEELRPLPSDCPLTPSFLSAIICYPPTEAQRIGGVGRGGKRKGPTQQAQTGPLFSSLSWWGANSHLGAHSILSLRVDKRSNARPVGKKSPAQSWQRSSPNNVLPSKYGAPRITRAEHHHTTGKVTLSHRPICLSRLSTLSHSGGVSGIEVTPNHICR